MAHDPREWAIYIRKPIQEKEKVILIAKWSPVLAKVIFFPRYNDRAQCSEGSNIPTSCFLAISSFRG